MAKTAAREAGLWNRLVNDKFEGKAPVLPADESVKAAKRLYRRAMGRPWDGPVKLTSGNRSTWVWRDVLVVNPDERHGAGGLREIIHSISHYAHSVKHPNDAPHSSRQVYLERDLVDYAIASGFLDGKLASKAKPKPPVEPKAKPDKVVVKYNAMVKRRDKWKAEAERANRLLKKAEAEVRTYERRHGERVKP
jgi:hypothetical protein